MSWYNSKGEKAPDVVVITDARGRKGHTFNPWADESWRVETASFMKPDRRRLRIKTNPWTELLSTMLVSSFEVCAE